MPPMPPMKKMKTMKPMPPITHRRQECPGARSRAPGHRSRRTFSCAGTPEQTQGSGAARVPRVPGRSQWPCSFSANHARGQAGGSSACVGYWIVNKQLLNVDTQLLGDSRGGIMRE